MAENGERELLAVAFGTHFAAELHPFVAPELHEL